MKCGLTLEGFRLHVTKFVNDHGSAAEAAAALNAKLPKGAVRVSRNNLQMFIGSPSRRPGPALLRTFGFREVVTLTYVKG